MNVSKCFVLILVIGFIAFLIPSLPAFLPISGNTDSAMHYQIAYNLWSGEDYYLFDMWDTYPNGFHIVVASISKIINVDPIYVIYPFICLIAALCAAVLYQIAIECGIDKTYGSSIGFLALMFFLPVYQLVVMGWWSMIFGTFFLLLFTLCLLRYVNNKTLYCIGLIVCQIMIILVYPFLAAISVLTFILAILKDFKSSKFVDMLVLAALLAVVLPVILSSFISPKLIVSEEKVNFERFVPFEIWITRETTINNVVNWGLTIFFIISLFGAYQAYRNKEQRFLLCFYLACFLIALALGLGRNFFGLREYPYVKMYYVWTYPAIVFTYYAFKDMVKKVNSNTLIGILVILSLISTQLVLAQVRSLGHQTQVLTSEQYDVALWVRNNVKENVTFLADTPQSYWFYVVSQANPTDFDLVYGKEYIDTKDGYNPSNKDKIIILNEEIMDSQLSFYVWDVVTNYKIIYDNPKIIILERGE